MKKHITKLLAAVAMTWLGGSAVAQDACATCAPVQQPAARGGWYASAGVLYLKQVGGSNPAFVTETYSGIEPNPAVPAIAALDPGQTELLGSSISNFNQNYNWSGRAEIGVKDSSGFGLRARFYWINDSSSVSFLDDSGVQSDPDFPGQTYNSRTGNRYLTANPMGINFASVGTETAPSALSYSRNLKLRAYDFDVTSDCNRGCLELTWFAGIRYMTINQSYNAFETVLNTDAFEFPDVFPTSQSLTSNHNVTAWGPTVGVEGRYPISCSLKAFASARFGILHAEGDHDVDVIVSSVGANFQVPNGSVRSSRCFGMPIGELELGAEYSRTLGCGCDGPELFVRGSVLAFGYWGEGNAARVTSNNMPGNEDLYFFGFSAQIGIRY